MFAGFQEYAGCCAKIVIVVNFYTGLKNIFHLMAHFNFKIFMPESAQMTAALQPDFTQKIVDDFHFCITSDKEMQKHFKSLHFHMNIVDLVSIAFLFHLS